MQPDSLPDAPEGANHASEPVHPGRAFAEDLRKLADLLDEHPDLAGKYPYYTLNRSVSGLAEMRTLIREVGGDWRKADDGTHLILRRVISDSIHVDVYSAHERVCERVVVGTRKVQQPAPDAPMIEVEEDIVEWRCPPSLLAEPEPVRLSDGLTESALDLAGRDTEDAA